MANIDINTENDGNTIKFVIDKSIQNEEGYHLTIDENVITITSKGPKGERERHRRPRIRQDVKDA